MHPYGVRDVERLLRLPRATLRALVAAGFVTPARGPRNAWRFSFQDLIVLRTAQALADAHVPQRRITRSVRELRRHLPESMPLSGLSIGAVGDRVVVREGRTRWQADSGQYLLEFGGDPATGALEVMDRPPVIPESSRRGPGESGHDWFGEAQALEEGNPEAAMRAYGNAIAADPANVDARINLGLLLHRARRLPEAGRVYSDALQACGPDPVLLFNLGVLLEDLDTPEAAERAYRAAVWADPQMADGHYNLALLYERLGKSREALRHMSEYRRLTRPHAV
jgi:Tetratricopeptide repeat/MerR HTH family regulatory protein